ncbi:MAG: hypothetical protein HDS56_09090 [Barnesiella sp.]|nr:hypothetical protein [Barnesiella sp.]
MKTLKHTIAAALILLTGAPEIVAQTSVQLISPSVKDINSVAAKVTKKKDDAEVRMILIKNCINEYLESPAVATAYTSATATEAADSVRTLKALLRTTRNTLTALDSRIEGTASRGEAEENRLAVTRDSLQGVLIAINKKKALTDSLISAYASEHEALSSGMEDMRAEAAGLTRRNEHASRIMDAASARRSHAATVVDQLNTMETEALRMDIDADFTPLLRQATGLLDDNRSILANYGHPQQMAEAELAVNHIAVLAEYSALIARARKVMASRYDAKAVNAVADELKNYFYAHGLDNKEHVSTVKTVIGQLESGALYYRQLTGALARIKDHSMGWMFKNGTDVPEFNTIMATVGDIPESYPLMIKAKADIVRQLRDSGKLVVRGEELTRIVDSIRSQF